MGQWELITSHPASSPARPSLGSAACPSSPSPWGPSGCTGLEGARCLLEAGSVLGAWGEGQWGWGQGSHGEPRCWGAWWVYAGWLGHGAKLLEVSTRERCWHHPPADRPLLSPQPAPRERAGHLHHVGRGRHLLVGAPAQHPQRRAQGVPGHLLVPLHGRR